MNDSPYNIFAFADPNVHSLGRCIQSFAFYAVCACAKTFLLWKFPPQTMLMLWFPFLFWLGTIMAYTKLRRKVFLMKVDTVVEKLNRL